MSEKWKEVVGYEQYYEVSNLGDIRRQKTKRVLIKKTKKSGYKFVCLSVDGKYIYKHIHRLVAEAFLSNTENKPQVNHIDCKKDNNCVTNLEWATVKENNLHARKNIVFKKQKSGVDNKLSFQVAQKINGDVVYLWGDILSISRHYNVVTACIHKAINKKTKSIGYEWERVTKKYYFDNKDKYRTIPEVIVDKRRRDTSIAQKQKLKNIKEKYTKDYLISKGVECYKVYGRIVRKEYDIFAKNNDTLTYTPVCNRFETWDKFKIAVLNKINLPT